MNEELMEFLVGKKKNVPTTPTSTTPSRNDDDVEDSTLSLPFQARPPSSRKGDGTRFTAIAAAAAAAATAFYKVLVQQWLDSDMFAENVLRSVVNLQDRILHEMILVGYMMTTHSNDCSRRRRRRRGRLSWKSYGYRGSSNDHQLRHDHVIDDDKENVSSCLTLDDINTTLDRDLLQHEAMLSQLRRTVSTMAQAQDAMGRRMSEWYNNIDDYERVNDATVAYYNDDGVETAQSLYVACAEELYRKQTMVQTICDASARDIGHAVTSGTAYNARPTTARMCLTKWNRLCAESYLVAKKDEIKSLIERYE